MTRPLTTKGAATRQRIVEAAARLIRNDGVEKVGLDDVLAATKTSKGQLFHYFPGGRGGLLYAVAEHEAAQVITDQQPFLDQLGSVASWRAWRDVVISKYREQGQACPLGSLTSRLGQTDPRIQPLIAALLDDWHARIERGVQRWLPEAPGGTTVDPSDAAVTILAAIQGGVGLLLATGRLRYLEVALDAALARLVG